MSKEGDDRILKDIITTGFEITGSVSGTLVGLSIAGPTGAILGSAMGPFISNALKAVGTDIKERLLSHRQNAKIGAAYIYAINKIDENRNNGKSFRTDDFFESHKTKRPSSVEALEGIVLSAQQEFEELKLKFLGNLYANACFDEEISRQHCNQLIKTVNALSFRQLCILQLLNERYLSELALDIKIRMLGDWELNQIDVIAEVRDLNQRGLVFVPMTFDGGNNSSPIQLSKLNITKSGLLFCKALSLDEIDRQELENLNKETALRE